MEYTAAIIVLNYNDAKTTTKFVEMIKNFKSATNIVVVDNCSTDNSYEELQIYKSINIDIIRTTTNLGYAKGNNYGAFYAINKYHPDCIVISNPDVEFNEEYLNTVIDASMSIPNAAMVSGVMKSLANIRKYQIAWRLPKFGDLVLSNFMLLRLLVGNRLEYTKAELSNETNPVEVIPGSFFAIRSFVFNEVKGFGEDTFLYEEENIISFKLKEAGYTNYLLKNISYLHIHAISINKSIVSVGKRLDMDFESRKVYIEQCLGVNRLQKIIFSATYYVGKYNYLCALKLFNIKR